MAAFLVLGIPVQQKLPNKRKTYTNFIPVKRKQNYDCRTNLYRMFSPGSLLYYIKWRSCYY